MERSRSPTGTRALAFLLVAVAMGTGCISPYRSGRSSMAAGDFESAVDHYTQAIVKDPLHFPALFFRGVAHEELRKYDAAQHDYSRAIEINHKFGTAHLARARLMTIQERYDEALRDYDRAIELKNSVAVDEMGTIFQVDEADAYYERGLSLLELGEYPRAIESFETTLALKADYARAYRGLGLARLGLGEKGPGCDDLSVSCGMGFEPSCTLVAERCR